MICFVALFVFAVLGLFSVKYRALAKESFDCVFRKVTLRRCETGLDKRIKMSLTGKLMAKSKPLARMFYRHFEMMSWALTVLMLASTFYSAQGLYNFWAYGNCNGEDSSAFCALSEFQNVPKVCTCGEWEKQCTETDYEECGGADCECLSKKCGPENASAGIGGQS